MRISAVDLFRVRLPLVRPFRTSFALEVDRDVLLVRVRSEAGVDGWAECVATSWPGYSSEYVDACVPVMREHLLPRLGTPPTSSRRTRRCCRSAATRCPSLALETAVLGRPAARGGSLAGDVPGSRCARRLYCGVGPAFPPTTCPTRTARPFKEVASTSPPRSSPHLARGSSPAGTSHPWHGVRERWAATSRCRSTRTPRRRGREHPPPRPSWTRSTCCWSSSRSPRTTCRPRPLARQIDARLLDESIVVASPETPSRSAPAAIINIKPGRVGGYLESAAIHDLCVARGTCRSGAAGCSRPASVARRTSHSPHCPASRCPATRARRTGTTRTTSRRPFVLADGPIAVPEGPGIGVRAARHRILAAWHEELRPS